MSVMGPYRRSMQCARKIFLSMKIFARTDFGSLAHITYIYCRYKLAWEQNSKGIDNHT